MLRSNFRRIAGGFLITYCSSFGQTFFLSASVAEWQSAFAMSRGEFGRLYMFATLAFGYRAAWTGAALALLLIALPLACWAYREPRGPQPAETTAAHRSPHRPSCLR